MAYKPFTIVEGTGPFSVRCNADGMPVHSGSVTCLTGTCYVRLLKTPTIALTASGANDAMTNLPTGSTFTNGWARLLTGSELTFGQERVLGATTSDAEPVGQIDIYCDDTSTVTCLQH